MPEWVRWTPMMARSRSLSGVFMERGYRTAREIVESRRRGKGTGIRVIAAWGDIIICRDEPRQRPKDNKDRQRRQAQCTEAHKSPRRPPLVERAAALVNANTSPW